MLIVWKSAFFSPNTRLSLLQEVTSQVYDGGLARSVAADEFVMRNDEWDVQPQ